MKTMQPNVSGDPNIFVRFSRLPMLLKIGSAILLVAVLWFGWSKTLGAKSNTPQYQTATATKDTLVVSVSASGSVSSANSAQVTTQTSGVVTKIYVKNGDPVKAGDKIADVDLDTDGKQRATQTLAAYQSAQNNLAAAQAALYSTQSTMYTKWNNFMNLATNGTYQNSDGTANNTNRVLPQFTTTNDDWLAAEALYKNQQSQVTQAQTAVSSAWAAYQQSSPAIYAPISGTISGLSFQVGSVLTAQTSTSGSSTSQRIANIKTDATPTAVVGVNETDIPKIKVGNKATMTMDAFPNQTFTGKVVSIDTTGTVTSGVTTYSAYIVFDSATDGIYPNMAVDANIITKVDADAILVPNAAVQTSNGQSTVRVLKNGQVTSVPVTVGDSDATNTQILSGIKEGDTVVTSVTTTTTNTTSTSSPFSSFGGGNRGFGGGAGVRVIRGGGGG